MELKKRNKQSKRISLKKSLIVLTLYAVLLGLASYQIYDYMYPVKDANLAMAADAYKQELASNSDNAGLHTKLGWTYHQIASAEHLSRFYRKAETEYKRALELAPTSVEAHYSLGLLYAELNKSAKSREQHDAILRIEPDHVLATYQLAILANKEGNRQESIKYYLKAIELQPTAGNLYYEVGRIYEDSQDKERAITMYQQAVKFLADATDANQRIQSLSGK